MARPIKQGLDYFPFDVNFFDDTKIEFISAKFGLKGEAIIIRLLAKIYKENGYYMSLDEDEILLFARKIGGNSGASVQFVRAVVSEAASRGVFDEAVWRNFRVLTSRGIQKRYIKACRDSKRTFPEKLEYDLIGYNQENGVLPGKILEETLVSSGGDSDNSRVYALKQNKTKQKKEDIYIYPENSEKTMVSSGGNPVNSATNANINCNRGSPSPTLQEIETYAVDEYPEIDHELLIGLAKRFYNFYEAQDWYTSSLNAVKIINWKAKYDEWLTKEMRDKNGAKRGFSKDKYQQDVEYFKQKFGI